MQHYHGFITIAMKKTEKRQKSEAPEIKGGTAFMNES